MANEYYDNSGSPSTGSALSSATIRAEYAAIEAAFDLLPTLTGNGGEVVVVNTGGTGLETVATTGTGVFVRTTSPTLTTPVISQIVNTGMLTLPTATTTLVGRTTTDTLTNKTLTSPVINSPTGIVKGDVGLGSVDNTSDATKNAASVTLTNKIINVDNNTLSGLAASSFVLSSGSGYIDGAAAQKVIPDGVVVGTTDSQTLTNKTIDASTNTLTGVATLTGSQTLTNKTISVDSNTLSGFAASSFALSDASGYLDGAAAQKAIPSGVVVGTTDSQTLTNKTLTSPVINTPTGIVKGDIGLGNVDNTSDATKNAATATLTNKTLTTPVLTTPVITGYTETAYVPSAGSAFAVDLANGTIQKLTTSANVTVTLPTPAAGKSYTLLIAYGGTHTLTWAGGGTIRWAGGAAPTATSVSGKVDTFTFWSVDSTDTFAAVGGQNA